MPLNLIEILKNFITLRKKINVTVAGAPSELYAHNMEYHHHYDEIMKHFGEGWLKDSGAIQKNLQLPDVNITLNYNDKYVLWSDFRTIDDNKLHGLGGQLENTCIRRNSIADNEEAGSAGKLYCYLYLFQDVQIYISDAQF